LHLRNSFKCDSTLATPPENCQVKTSVESNPAPAPGAARPTNPPDTAAFLLPPASTLLQSHCDRIENHFHNPTRRVCLRRACICRACSPCLHSFRRLFSAALAFLVVIPKGSAVVPAKPNRRARVHACRKSRAERRYRSAEGRSEVRRTKRLNLLPLFLPYFFFGISRPKIACQVPKPLNSFKQKEIELAR
jgi:hypothetical protein